MLEELFAFIRPPVWTVTDLTRYLRDLLESDANLADIWVQGEVSNVVQPRSGHLYFTLKDAEAQLRVVMWKPRVRRLRFMPQNGQQVEVHGAISIYEAGGVYQLYADTIRPVGEGPSTVNSCASRPAWRPKGCSTKSANARCRTSRGASAS